MERSIAILAKKERENFKKSANGGVPGDGFKKSRGDGTGEGVEMESSKRAEMIKKFIEEKCLTLIKTKGDDYNQGDMGKDANSNFKRIGKKLALNPFKVWAVYFFKHIDAIETWLLDGKVKSEPIEGRIADAVNYLLILHTMIQEKNDDEFLSEQLPVVRRNAIPCDKDSLQQFLRDCESVLGAVADAAAHTNDGDLADGAVECMNAVHEFNLTLLPPEKEASDGECPKDAT